MTKSFSNHFPVVSHSLAQHRAENHLYILIINLLLSYKN